MFKELSASSNHGNDSDLLQRKFRAVDGAPNGGISGRLQAGTSESGVVEHFKTKSPSQSERQAQRETHRITRESGGSQIALRQCERGELGRFGCDPAPAIRGALSCFSASVLRLSPAFIRAVPVA
jgi:hypothetical protein